MGDFLNPELSLRISGDDHLIATISNLQLSQVVSNKLEQGVSAELMLTELLFDVLHVQLFKPNGEMSDFTFSEEYILRENIPSLFTGRTEGYPIRFDLGEVPTRGNYGVLVNKHMKDNNKTYEVDKMRYVSQVVAPGAGFLTFLQDPVVEPSGNQLKVSNIRLRVTLPADNGGDDIKTVSYLFFETDVSGGNHHYTTHEVNQTQIKQGFVDASFNIENNVDVGKTLTGISQLKVKCYLSHGVDISEPSNTLTITKSLQPAAPELLTALSGLDEKIDISFKAPDSFKKASVVMREVDNNDANKDTYYKTDINNILAKNFIKNADDEYSASIAQVNGAKLTAGTLYNITMIFHSEDLSYDANVLENFKEGSKHKESSVSQSINSNILTAIPSKSYVRSITKSGLAEETDGSYTLKFKENHNNSTTSDQKIITMYSLFKNNTPLSVNKNVFYQGKDKEISVSLTETLTSTDVIKLVLTKRGQFISKDKLPFILNTNDGVSFDVNNLNYLTLLDASSNTIPEVSAEYRLSIESDVVKPQINDVWDISANGSRTLLIHTITPKLPDGVDFSKVIYNVNDNGSNKTNSITVTDNKVDEFHKMTDFTLDSAKTYFVTVQYQLIDKRNTENTSIDSSISDIYAFKPLKTVFNSTKGVTLINDKLGFMRVTADKNGPADHALVHYEVTLYSENGTQIDNAVIVKGDADGKLDYLVELNDTFNNSPTRFMYRDTIITASVKAKFLDKAGKEVMGAEELSEPVLMYKAVTVIPGTIKIELDNTKTTKTVKVSADLDYGRMLDSLVHANVIVPNSGDGVNLMTKTNSDDPKSKQFSTAEVNQEDDMDYADLKIYIITAGPNSVTVATYP